MLEEEQAVQCGQLCGILAQKVAKSLPLVGSQGAEEGRTFSVLQSSIGQHMT